MLGFFIFMIASNIIKITILNHARYMIDIALSNVNTFSIFTPITEVIFTLEAKNNKFQEGYILAY